MALYFAYGSNMATARLGARVPTARAIGVARLADFAWRCNKRGADGTAKANLVREAGAETWGVLYELDAAAFDVLDRVEGGYERIVVTVAYDTGPRRAHTYVSERLVDGEAPAPWYLALVVSGAREHALPPAWIASLERLAAPAPDDDGDRMVFDDPANACFGCSTSNPRGLALAFAPIGDGVETTYVAATDLCGMHGVVHGGIQAAMLDEAMGHAAHAALAGEDLDIATIELAVRYHRPTPTGEPITIRARLVRTEDRDLWMEAEIRDGRDRVCTEATSRWRRLQRRPATTVS
jgi:uncharacterized protein (TIGR00369 family)